MMRLTLFNKNILHKAARKEGDNRPIISKVQAAKTISQSWSKSCKWLRPWKRLTALLLFTIICAPSMAATIPSPKIKKVTIHNSKHFSHKQLIEWFGLKKGQLTPANLNANCKRLIEHLQVAGFYFAKLDSINQQYSIDSTTVNFSVFLDEGERLKVWDYQVQGIDSLRGKTNFRLRVKKDRFFSSTDLETDANNLINWLAMQGYAYGQVHVAELSLLNRQKLGSAMKVVLLVEPGRQIRIADIRVYGNKQTKKATILRELPIGAGDLFHPDRFHKIESALTNLGYFKWVNPPRLELLNGGNARVVIELGEGPQNRFDGVLGYNPGADGKDGFVSGLLNFGFGNLFGTGRELEAKWERRSESTQAFRLRYIEPWVAGFPLQAGFGFEQLIQDSSYIERNIGIDALYRLNETLRLSAGVNFREVSPDSATRFRLGIQPSSSLDLSIGLHYNNLDNILNPGRGVLFATTFTLSRKDIEKSLTEPQLTPQNNVEQKHISLDLAAYIPLWNWQVFALNLHGREVRSVEEIVPIPDQYRLGGARSLRGYREEQFRGERLAWMNIEYRYLLGQRSRLFVFTDIGYIFRRELDAEQNIRLIELVKPGFGFGARLETRLGLLGLDYGLGQGDGFSSGKIHISVINEF